MRRFFLLIMAGLLINMAPADAAGRFTRVVDPAGTAIDLYSEETGSGPPLVLIHGLGGSTYSWSRAIPALALTNRVIAIDLKGFGRSGKLFDDAYSAVDQARLISQFIVRRNLRGVTLAGHSFGGNVTLVATLLLNRASPGRIRRVALIDTPALPQPLTPFVAFLQQPVLPYALLTLLPPELSVRFAMTPAGGHADPNAETDIIAQAAPFHDPAAKHALIATARQIIPPDFARIIAAYRSITQPALLLWCRDDSVVPLATGQKLVRLLPRGKLTVLDGCDHVPQWDQPAEFARRLAAFAR